MKEGSHWKLMIFFSPLSWRVDSGMILRAALPEPSPCDVGSERSFSFSGWFVLGRRRKRRGPVSPGFARQELEWKRPNSRKEADSMVPLSPASSSELVAVFARLRWLSSMRVAKPSLPVTQAVLWNEHPGQLVPFALLLLSSNHCPFLSPVVSQHWGSTGRDVFRRWSEGSQAPPGRQFQESRGLWTEPRLPGLHGDPVADAIPARNSEQHVLIKRKEKGKEKTLFNLTEK